MAKLNTIITIAAAVAACINVEATNLRQHETSCVLTVTGASDNGSRDFFSEESDSSDSATGKRFLGATIDSSSFVVDLESSTDASDDGSKDRFLVEDDTSSSVGVGESKSGSGLQLLVEVESSVDGSTVLDSSEGADGKANGDVTDSNDSIDDSEDNGGPQYQPGTVKPAPIDGSGVFDKSSLSWWK